ncbi:MAG: hypothetical protein K6A74_06715 [Lachnospiraceae bacterium]|nr:hypothetical protein [Lachnospiraceae bacterium]
MKYNLWISYTMPQQYSNDIGTDVNIIIPYDAFDDFSVIIDMDKKFYVNLPMVVRDKDKDGLRAFIESASKDERVKGVVINNTESLMLLQELVFAKEIITGAGLYAWNEESQKVYSKLSSNYVYPYELSRHEMTDNKESRPGILTVYGRFPLMVSANCIRNTAAECKGGAGETFGYLKDRKNMLLPVLFQCKNCYNIVYNPIPTSLHEFVGSDIDFTKDLLISFTDESDTAAGRVIDFYRELLNGNMGQFPIKEFTKAYFTHGVE